jgi:Bacterial DNA topoisomerase IB, N-terminal domain
VAIESAKIDFQQADTADSVFYIQGGSVKLSGTKERRNTSALPPPNGSRRPRVARPAPPARRVFCGTPALIECYLCRRGSFVSIFSSGASFNEGRQPVPHPLSPARAVARRLGLCYVDQDELTWRRTRRGKRFSYLRQDGSIIRHPVTIHRLAGLAVPPAYDDVRYATDPAAHLQAVGRDADTSEVLQPIESGLDAPAQLVQTRAEAKRLLPV